MAGLNDLSDEQLVHKMLGIERNLVASRFAHAQNQLENTASLRVLRKDIARIQTETRKREVQGGLPKDGLLAIHRTTFKADGVGTDGGSESGGFLQGIVDKLTGDEK
jgi:large subunit ribosomal protein L29